jgi:hypothetical protein
MFKDNMNKTSHRSELRLLFFDGCKVELGKLVLLLDQFSLDFGDFFLRTSLSR